MSWPDFIYNPADYAPWLGDQYYNNLVYTWINRHTGWVFIGYLN